MPKRERSVPGQIYHLCNRGVDKRNIFLDEKDYLRAVHDLFEFNDETPALNAGYFSKSIASGTQYQTRYQKSRKLIVELMAFCLMPNHFHLLIKPLGDGYLEQFMLKFGGGYASYFNRKYKRSGTLFQGRYKSIPVTKEPHFIHLPFYIHANPLDLSQSGWRQKEIKDPLSAIKFLETYRWSSYPDYIGIKNFPSVTQRDFLLKFFDNSQHYKKSMGQWLRNMSLENIEDIALEPIY